MSGPGIFLFFTGLLMFAIALILLISLSSQNHQWWMWLLLFLGIILIIWGAILWFATGTITTLSQGGAFQGGIGGGGKGGASSAEGEAGFLGEAEEAAIFL